MTSARAPLVLEGGQRFGPEHLVLTTLLPEEQLAGTSRYSDDVWHLGPAERMGHAKRLSLHFETLPASFREVSKQLHALQLERRVVLAGNGRPLSMSTIRGRFTAIKDFTWFLDSIGVSRLRDVNRRHLAQYVGLLRRHGRLKSTYLTGIRAFWLYRTHLVDAMTVDPETLPMWTPAQIKRGSENATNRIPEEVLDPLIWWSSLLIKDLAPDILTASAEFARLFETTKGGTGTSPELPRGEAIGRVRAIVQLFRDSGEKLPGHLVGARAGRVNMVAMERLAGVQRGTIRHTERVAIRELGAINGVEANLYLSSRPQAKVDGALWRERFSYREIPDLVRVLHAACYTVIAFFSGMRDSEVKHLRSSCAIVDKDETGKLAVHLVQGATFKGNAEPTGKSATWVVAPLVHDAVKVLDELVGPDENRLFRPIRAGRISYGQSDEHELVSVPETNASLEALTDWILSFHAATGVGPALPDVDGQPWRLTTRQFRRTLAWYIARRPGGVAAGALQYKHMSVQMFRGYAGTSASGFAEEVEAEQALARGEWLGDFAADAGTVIGRARDEIARRLDSWQRTVGFGGRLPENPTQLARLLKRHDPHVYQGKAVTCVFDPAKALCLSKTRRGEAPDLRACAPLRCANSVFSSDQVMAWRERAADMLALSSNETITPYVRARAKDHAERLTSFFDQLERNE